MCGGWFSGLISWSAYIKTGASIPNPSPSPEVKPPPTFLPSSPGPERGLDTTTITDKNNPRPTSPIIDPGQTNTFPSGQQTSVIAQPPPPPPPTPQPTSNESSTTSTSPVPFSAYVIGTLSGATIVLFIGFAVIYARKEEKDENNTPDEKDAQVVEMNATILAQLGKQRIIARHDSRETLDSFDVGQRRKASSIPRLMMIGASASNGLLAKSAGGTLKAGTTIRTGRSSMSGVGGGNDGAAGGAVLGKMSDGLIANLVAVAPRVAADTIETEDSLNDNEHFLSYVPPSSDSITSELSARSSSVYMDILERNNDDLDSLESF
ncbi:UNVERIFIED_CONTAM: hypothetical protein HDU68_000111 [Siphonaria sp. JEL0065]|nr:hypothetical protein HDU68_000111 [Siphonaria sp. JEL0065]